MSGSLLLACDLGTSGLKLALVDAGATPSGGRRVRATATHPYGTRFSGEGWAEQDPDDWLSAFEAAFATLRETQDLARLCGIAFTGQMSAALPVDHDGQSLRPALIWSDQRAVHEAADAARHLDPAAFHRRTGCPLTAACTAPRLAWLARHEPETMARAALVLQPKDWLITRLGGRPGIDASDASATGLYDIERGEWAADLFAAFGIPFRLAPPLRAATSLAGAARGALAARLGLRAGLPLIAGGGDGPTSAVGAGIGAGGPAYLSLGTSAWVSMLAATPAADPAGRLLTMRHVFPGCVAVTGSLQNVGSVLNWVARDLFEHADVAAEIAAALAEVVPGSDGLLMLPYLQGERTPYWDSAATGALVGLRHGHGRRHVMRAALESIGYAVRLVLETFAEAGCPIASMRVIGGLSTDRALTDLLSTIAEVEFERLPEARHATSLGAAMVGATALGLHSGEADAGWTGVPERLTPPEPLPAYQDGYRRFKALYRALAPGFAHDAGA